MTALIRKLALLTALPLLLGACSSGDGTAELTLVISDAPVGDLASVTITIDQITLNRPGTDVVIDSFPNEDPDLRDTDTITIDLLEVQGLDNVLVVDGIEVPVGEYQNMRLSIIDEDIDASWVEEVGGARFPIKVPSEELKLGRFEVLDEGVQTFVLEFNLAKALTFNPKQNPSASRYILKPRGVRIVDVGRAALLGGNVDDDLFDGEPPCDGKVDPAVGNMVYLYQGHDLDLEALGDNFDPELDPTAAATLAEPYAAETVGEDGAYLFAYLPAGAYTVAFSCDAIDDDADLEDGIVIPSPEGQAAEISLDEGEALSCDFPLVGGQCG
jgi:hypothetical protein